METAIEKIYPTNPDVTGWFYESEEDESFGIRTNVAANGDITKAVKFSDGREAIIKELTGNDIMKATKMVGDKNKDNSKVILAMMCLATLADGQIIPMEDIGRLKAKDYTKLMAAYSAINF